MSYFNEESFVEHQPWSKIPRFFDTKLVVSEKLDGTNGVIYINKDLNDELYIQAGSRNRWLTREDDNYGFAKFVDENQKELIKLLGEGFHYGEWWGQGIQRGYNMDRKVFSLFNTKRWSSLWDATDCICDVVPHLSVYLSDTLDNIIADVEKHFMPKSLAAAKYGVDFLQPEGYMIYHTRLNRVLKVPKNK